MPIRTRADMHIGLDLALEVLNSTPTNRMDPAVKDFFLNRTITEYVKGVVKNANEPDENKRVPFRILTHGDILSKYNDIYTLIKVDDSLLPLARIDNNFYQYTLPSDIFRFEASYTNVRPVDCVTYPSAIAPTVANSSGAGTVTAGLHYYFVIFVYPTEETDITSVNIASLTVASSKNVELTNIPLGLTGCTARKIYRTKVSEPWYRGRLITTLNNNTATTFTDTLTDAQLGDEYAGNTHDTELNNLLLSTYDVISFNQNSYGGKRKYIATILESTVIRVYHLQRYIISKFGIIYVKNPAILTSSPGVVNCDLPSSVHDRIIDDTAKYISAAVNSGNYPALLNEAKENK